MKYMLLTYLDEKAWAALSEAEQQKIMGECGPHVKAMATHANPKWEYPYLRHPPARSTTVMIP